MSVLLDTLQQHGLSQTIRGSWKYDDFHLSGDGSYTRSDLDLVMDGTSENVRRKYVNILQDKLSGVLPLRVSIHGSDSLLEMDLDDSIILNMGEFIAKTVKLIPADPEFAYTLAKIALLLLRISTRERYVDVSRRIGPREAEIAIGVKLGWITSFSIETAATLLSLSTHPTVGFFVSNCVHRPPSRKVVAFVREQIRLCRTIAPWLQDYLISKMDGGTK